MDELDYKHTDEVKCPHCDYEHSDSWELSNSGEMECSSCGEEFMFDREVTVTYSTRKTII